MKAIWTISLSSGFGQRRQYEQSPYRLVLGNEGIMNKLFIVWLWEMKAIWTNSSSFGFEKRRQYEQKKPSFVKKLIKAYKKNIKKPPPYHHHLVLSSEGIWTISPSFDFKTWRPTKKTHHHLILKKEGIRKTSPSFGFEKRKERHTDKLTIISFFCSRLLIQIFPWPWGSMSSG